MFAIFLICNELAGRDFAGEGLKIIVSKFVFLSRFEWLSANDERHVCEFSCTNFHVHVQCTSTRHNNLFANFHGVSIGRLVEFHKLLAILSNFFF